MWTAYNINQIHLQESVMKFICRCSLSLIIHPQWFRKILKCKKPTGTLQGSGETSTGQISGPFYLDAPQFNWGLLNVRHMKESVVSGNCLTLWFPGLWHHRGLVPEDPTEGGSGSVPPGECDAGVAPWCVWVSADRCVVYTVGVSAGLGAALSAGAASAGSRGLQSSVLLPPQPHRDRIRVLSLSVE